jgi:transposase
VRSVARAHDIPSNQLFHWRKLYREGLLGNQEQATQSKLMEVRLVGEQQQAAIADQASHQPAITAGMGTIQLATAKGRLCICGAADPTILRAVLERWLG